MWPFGSEKKPAKPSFSRALTYTRRLPKFTLSIVAPRGDGHDSSDIEVDLSLDLNPGSFELVEGEGGDVAYRYIRLLFLSWKMRGAPFFSSNVGEVGVSIRLIETPWLGVNESLFDPMTLVECLRKEFLIYSKDKTYGLAGEDEFDLSDYRIPRRLEMIGCQWLKLSGIPVLYYEGMGLRDSIHDVYYIVPVDDNAYLRISGFIWRSVVNGGNYYRIDQRVPIEPFREVIDQVVQSFSIKPAPDLEERLNHLRNSLSASAPRLAPSQEYVYIAKSAIKRSSSVGFSPKRNQDKQIAPLEASRFIDEITKPRKLPNSYDLSGSVISVHPDADLSPVPISFRKEVPPPWEQ